MIWNSIFLMTLIDILIIIAALYLIAIFHRHYKASKSLGLSRGIHFILFGLIVTALFYLGDLLIMHVLPSARSHEYAMAVMKDFHLNWSWTRALISMGTIALGLSYLIRILIPKATSSVDNLEQQVQARTAELQKEIDERKRTEEALTESRERFRRLSKAPFEGIVISEYGKIIDANKQLFRGSV